VFDPVPGKYTIAITAWYVESTYASYCLFWWDVGGEASNNLVVTAPQSGVAGASATVEVQWSGLAAGTKASSGEPGSGRGAQAALSGADSPGDKVAHMTGPELAAPCASPRAECRRRGGAPHTTRV
jgi:hypothetical protein